MLINRTKEEEKTTLPEKCPNTEFFSVLRFTLQIAVFSPNTRKCGPEKNPYLDTFHAVRITKSSGKLHQKGHKNKKSYLKLLKIFDLNQVWINFIEANSFHWHLLVIVWKAFSWSNNITLVIIPMAKYLTASYWLSYQWQNI